MSGPRKSQPAPLLPRETEWSNERIAALTLIEMRALQANAERLGETDIAERCAKAIKDRPRPVAVKKIIKPKAPVYKKPPPSVNDE